jgi:hypothetical protein
VAIVTGTYGARVLRPLLASLDRHDVRVVEVDNRFFGGNIGVAGLMVGEDIARVLAGEPSGHRYLLPDVCLSSGRFLDGTTPEELPRPVEVVPTDGIALRRLLDHHSVSSLGGGGCQPSAASGGARASDPPSSRAPVGVGGGERS